MQGCLNIQNSTNVICHISRIKEQNHVIILKDEEKKAFDRSNTFKIKTLNKSEIDTGALST